MVACNRSSRAEGPRWWLQESRASSCCVVFRSRREEAACAPEGQTRCKEQVSVCDLLQHTSKRGPDENSEAQQVPRENLLSFVIKGEKKRKKRKKNPVVIGQLGLVVVNSAKRRRDAGTLPRLTGTNRSQIPSKVLSCVPRYISPLQCSGAETRYRRYRTRNNNTLRRLERLRVVCKESLLSVPFSCCLVRSYGKKGLLQMQAPVARLAQREPR